MREKEKNEEAKIFSRYIICGCYCTRKRRWNLKCEEKRGKIVGARYLRAPMDNWVIDCRSMHTHIYIYMCIHIQTHFH